MVILRIITTDEDSGDGIIAFLSAEQFGVTHINAHGSRGDARLILSLVNRTDLPKITGFLNEHYPKAFFSVEDIRYANEGVFRPASGDSLGILSRFTSRKRK